jgi:hypothetical protein
MRKHDDTSARLARNFVLFSKTNVRIPLADFGNAVGPLLGTRFQKDGEGEAWWLEIA